MVTRKIIFFSSNRDVPGLIGSTGYCVYFTGVVSDQVQNKATRLPGSNINVSIEDFVVLKRGSYATMRILVILC